MRALAGVPARPARPLQQAAASIAGGTDSVSLAAVP